VLPLVEHRSTIAEPQGLWWNIAMILVDKDSR